jgi:hypothetical protein
VKHITSTTRNDAVMASSETVLAGPQDCWSADASRRSIGRTSAQCSIAGPPKLWVVMRTPLPLATVFSSKTSLKTPSAVAPTADAPTATPDSVMCDKVGLSPRWVEPAAISWARGLCSGGVFSVPKKLRSRRRRPIPQTVPIRVRWSGLTY